MDELPDLTPNFDFILQNLNYLEWKNLIMDDKDLYQLFTEIYTFNCSEDFGEPDTYNVVKYGENFVDSLKIGEGSYGQIYAFKDKVIKFYCNASNSFTNKPIKIIREKDKTVLDNELAESICALYFNRIIENYSPFKYEIYGTYIPMLSLDEAIKGSGWVDYFHIEDYNKYYGNYLISMTEKLSVIPENMLDKYLYYILLVVLHNIYIGQSLSKFVHGDLHMGNIMYKKYTEKTIRLTYLDEIIEIENVYDFIPIIIDFGFSSFNDGNIRYVPLTEPLTVSGSAFDTYFDTTKLFTSLMRYYKKRKYDYRELENIFMETKASNINEYLYEPEIYRITQIYKKYKPRFITDILQLLLKKVNHSIIHTKTNIPRIIGSYSDVINFTGDYFQVNSFIKYENIKYHSLVLPHFTEAKYSPNLNIHLLTINKYMNGHEFTTKCCKQNVYDFVLSGGIAAINGTYFSLIDAGELFNNMYNYYYASDDFLEKYIDDYGYINVNRDYIEIKDYSSDDHNELMSAPLLFINGIKTNLEEKILEMYNDVYKYSCSNKFKKNFIGCDEIPPGELYHIGNPNPRTILANKGDITYFIVIEGRSDEYKGATIEQMYDFLSSLKVDNAINLDGGASSRMMWRSNDKIYSPQTFISPKTVGNIIGII